VAPTEQAKLIAAEATMDASGYRGNPFSPPPPGSQRRRHTRRNEADAWVPSPSEWFRIPPLVPYFSASFHPRVFEECHRRSSQVNAASPDDGLSPGHRPQGFPVEMAGHSGHEGARDPRLGCGSAEPALRELYHQLSSAHALFDGFHQAWKKEKAKFPYAKKESLRSLWQDRIQDKMKGSSEGKWVRGLGDRISKCIQQARDAVEMANFLDFPPGPYIAHRRKRVVQKVGLSCDAIVDLADQALLDPAACEVLLKELEEAIAAVDPTKEDLYGKQTGKKLVKAEQCRDERPRDDGQQNTTADIQGEADNGFGDGASHDNADNGGYWPGPTA